MPKANIKMKYKDVGTFEFGSLMEKLSSTPTSNKNACMISHIYKENKRAREQISEEYKKEVMEKYATRDENGAIKRPSENPDGFIPDETKLEEFKKAQEDFGEKEFVFEWGPLRPAHLTDVKVSAKEIGLMGELFNTEDAPGMPQGFGISQAQ